MIGSIRYDGEFVFRIRFDRVNQGHTELSSEKRDHVLGGAKSA